MYNGIMQWEHLILNFSISYLNIWMISVILIKYSRRKLQTNLLWDEVTYDKVKEFSYKTATNPLSIFVRHPEVYGDCW